MFDKMIFNIKISIEKEAAQIAERNNLEKWQSGAKTEYKSGKDANFEGVMLSIKDGKLQIKCSLHKVYFKQVYGALDNSGMFTISNAHRALNLLFDYIGIEKERAKITYFEIGLNLPVKYEPLEYIKRMKSIMAGKTSVEKILFIDANFEKDRQRTTEKKKTIKKVFKVYDKEFENADRRREPKTGEHILRIETMYRRQSIGVSEFFSKENIDRLLHCFYKDWARIEFERKLTVDSGIHKSEMHNAEKVLLLGAENYLRAAKADFADGTITERKYRTIREFIRDWNDNKHKYRMLPSEYESEYRQILLEKFNIAKY
jgi:hypothetical protein